jgi:hypothetical protein
MAPPSTDATLSDLRVNNVTVPGFAADKYEYTIDVPYGTAVGSDLVQVTAEKNDPNATMNINQATALPGAATVVVTAEDGIASNTYTVNFNVLPNTAAEITSFSFADETGPAVINSAAGTIAIEVAYGTNQTNLVATFELSDYATATVNGVPQISGVTANNFSSPVTYVVTAAAGNTKNWEVTVTVAPCNIATVSSEVYLISKGGTAHETISNVPYNTSKETFLGNISEDGPRQMWNTTGLHDPIRDGDILIVTAEDGVTTVTYTIEVIPASTDATLSDLRVDGTTVSGFAPENTAYEIELPYGTTTMPIVTATVHDTEKATCTITQATGLNPPNNVATVEVTAEDGVTKKTYTITFTEALNPAKEITSFSFVSPAASGVINEAAKTIAVTVPFGTDVTSLTPTIVHTGASITPASGTSQDFSSPVIYTVTAEDGTTAQYTVTVTISPNTDASLTSLSVNPGSIDFDSDTLTYNNVEVPYGTSTVTVTFTAASQATTSVPSPQVVNIVGRVGTFSVEVTAGDGVNKKTYTINFKEGPNNDATLSEFTVGGHDVLHLENVTTTGAIYPVSDFTNFGGIVATPTDPNAQSVTVTINGTPVAEDDLASRAILPNDVIVVTGRC